MRRIHRTFALPLALTAALFTPSVVEAPEDPKTLQIHYLEIVTADVDAQCELLSKIHGVEFGEPVLEFGGARTAPLAGGGMLGVRAPMREDEEPVVRPYILVEDLDGRIEAAGKAGAEIAIPPMALGDKGRFAMFLSGGIDHGLWEN